MNGFRLEFARASLGDVAKAEAAFRKVLRPAGPENIHLQLRKTSAALRFQLYHDATVQLLTSWPDWKPKNLSNALALDMAMWRSCTAGVSNPVLIRKAFEESVEHWIALTDGTSTTVRRIGDIPVEDRLIRSYFDRRIHLIQALGEDPNAHEEKLARPAQLWLFPRLMLWAGALGLSDVTQSFMWAAQEVVLRSVSDPISPILDKFMKMVTHPPRRKPTPEATEAGVLAVMAAQEASPGRRLKDPLRIFIDAVVQAGGSEEEAKRMTKGGLRSAIYNLKKSKKK